MSGLDLERLIALRRVTATAPSPCGRWLAVEVQRLDEDGAKYVSDLWRVALDSSAEPVRLTHGPHNDRAPCYRRDGSLGFLSDRPLPGEKNDEAEKRTQVWLLPIEGGEPRPLTDEPLGVMSMRFAHAADRLVAIAPVLPGVPHAEQREHARDQKKNGPSALRFTRTPVRYWDHWIEPAAPHVIAYDANGGGRRDLTPDADREHREPEWALSADGRSVVVSCDRPGPDRIDDRCLRLIDLTTEISRDLGVEPRARYEHPCLSPDGMTVASVREARFDDRAPKLTLTLHDVASGKARPLAEGWDVWPVPETFSADGSALLATAAFGADVPVFRVELATGEVARVTSAESRGSHGGLDVVGDSVVGIRHRLLHPPEPFRVADAAGSTPELVAQLSGMTEEDGLAVAGWESFTVDAEDGTKVQSFLVRPREADGPRPTLVWIHGGPMSAWGDGWHWRWNPLVIASAGYSLVLPNPRGSVGFGQGFVDGIWNNAWGGECYRDLLRTVDAAAAHDAVDGERMCAMGGSFGGYMSNWVGGQTDRFRCIVTHASIFDLSAFYGVTDVPPWFGLELGGHPFADPESFDRYSPHRFVSKWKTPTLIIHGERDYRVPIGEALMLFEALQLYGVESELMIFPDENHWILKPRNIREWYGTVLDFVGRHLCPED